MENFIDRIKEISTELRSHPIYRYIAKQSNKIKYLQRTNEYWKDKAISLLASLQSQNNIKYTNLEDKLKIFYCTLLKYQDNITEYQLLCDSNTIDKDIKLLIEVCNRIYKSKDKIEKIFDCEYLSNIELEISKYSYIMKNQWKEIQNLAKSL